MTLSINELKVKVKLPTLIELNKKLPFLDVTSNLELIFFPCYPSFNILIAVDSF